MADEELVTYRRYLIEQTYIGLALSDNPPMSPLLVVEAVESTAIEHPEWPMDEQRTRAQWNVWESMQ